MRGTQFEINVGHFRARTQLGTGRNFRVEIMKIDDWPLIVDHLLELDLDCRYFFLFFYLSSPGLHWTVSSINAVRMKGERGMKVCEHGRERVLVWMDYSKMIGNDWLIKLIMDVQNMWRPACGNCLEVTRSELCTRNEFSVIEKVIKKRICVCCLTSLP